MSGIAGIVDKRGRPVDSRLLDQMAASMAFRGPDGGGVWTDGGGGLVHRALVTSGRFPPTPQPCSLDGTVWISADARIDGRQALAAKLGEKGAEIPETASDAELILLAYGRWGQRCLDHLIGDFAFAIWDGNAGRLFCARDHFGIKPFFYVQTGRSLLFSNTLNCLRTHPETTDTLDDRAIADFLIYGMTVHQDRSAFADIRRLPAAHFMTWSQKEGLKVDRYWALSLPDLLHYRHRRDYIDQFLDLLQQAVDDRLRTNRALISMSGGLDSTSVAAAACNCRAHRNGDLDLQAATGFYHRLVADNEQRYARRAAKKLGLRLHAVQMDEAADDPWIGDRFKTPEPTDHMVFSGAYRRTMALVRNFRVALTGQGGDPTLYPAPASFPFFLKKFFLGTLGLDILGYRLKKGRLPRMDIRKCFRRWVAGKEGDRAFPLPPWLEKTFLSRLKSDGRWTGMRRSTRRIDALRGGAYVQLTDPMWPNIFESEDSGVTAYPVEIRHPYFDLRLVSFLLSLPPVPWCVDKHIVRKAMENRLPGSVLNRPKATIPGFPEYERLRRDNLLAIHARGLNGKVSRYVDLKRYRAILSASEKLRPDEFTLITRPLLLAKWIDRMDGKTFQPGGN